MILLCWMHISLYTTLFAAILWFVSILSHRIFTIYTRTLPLDVACRVWDLFCRDGDCFLFKTALGEPLPLVTIIRHACTNHYKFNTFGLDVITWPQWHQCTELVVIRARMSDLLCCTIDHIKAFGISCACHFFNLTLGLVTKASSY